MKATEAVQPGKGTFGHPEVAAKPVGTLGVATDDAPDDFSAAEERAQVKVVAALVAMQDAGTASPGGPRRDRTGAMPRTNDPRA